LVYTRHTGAKHAQGDILLFGDDDATFDNNWVSAVIDVFSCHPQVGAVGTKIEIDWDQTPPIWIREYENSLGKLNYGGSIVIEIGLIINGGSFAIKKDILYALKGFNPGQSGQYILGDSETGLCRKMAIEHIAVGWSPFATMWHKQRKDENGTIRDIKRRMINQGICDAYYICFYDLKLRIQVREVFCRIGSLTITLTNYLLSPSCDHSLKRLILKTTYTVSFLKYIFYFGFNRSKGNSDLNRPWELTNKYAYPDLTFEIKIQ
jgi:GT2 family glycosyltransferase